MSYEYCEEESSFNIISPALALATAIPLFYNDVNSSKNDGDLSLLYPPSPTRAYVTRDDTARLDKFMKLFLLLSILKIGFLPVTWDSPIVFTIK